MENQFCIRKSKLIQIFWRQTTEEHLAILLEKFSSKYSKVEILQQMVTKTGEVEEYFEEWLKKFRTDTTNIEIAHSIILADFYFLESDPLICFEMKDGFKKDNIKHYKELSDNIEQRTEIDVLIKDDSKQFKFQLKQYPEEYKEWNVDKVIEYFDNSILLKYNHKNNKYLIIAIHIQPKLSSQIKEVSRTFKKVHEYLATKDIKLLQVVFLVNWNIEFMLWHEVFPKLGHYKIPWADLSVHQAKKR